MATRYDIALGRKPVQPVPHVEEPIPVLKSVFHRYKAGDCLSPELINGVIDRIEYMENIMGIKYVDKEPV